MVSEWMPNGNIRQFVQEYTQVDRLRLVCLSTHSYNLTLVLMLRQLLDICQGLLFLHSHDVIHGDLKGVRISNVSPPNAAD